MLKELMILQEKMRKVNSLQKEILEIGEQVRSYYKHQNEHTSSLSEELIVCISNQDDYEEEIYIIDQFLDYEE